MASNTTHTVEAVAAHSSRPQPFSSIPKRRPMSWRAHLPPSDATTPTCTNPHTALMHGHDHERPAERTRHLLQRDSSDDAEEAQANKSKKIEMMIPPYLAQHIPHQYNPLGTARDGPEAPAFPANTKYCYRHRPDLLCRRQADEPSMEQLQHVRELPSTPLLATDGL